MDEMLCLAGKVEFSFGIQRWRERAVRTNKFSIASDGKHVVIISSVYSFSLGRLGMDFGRKRNENLQFSNS